jgi:hypothetical protein
MWWSVKSIFTLWRNAGLLVAQDGAGIDAQYAPDYRQRAGPLRRDGIRRDTLCVQAQDTAVTP